jgi:DNA polymerase-1
MRFKRALIDGDVLLYSVCRGLEREEPFAHDYTVLWTDPTEVIAVLDQRIDQLRETVGAEEAVLYVSSDTNWRKGVVPTYKNHRKDVRKPLAFNTAKRHMIDTLGARQFEGLEADDLLGIDTGEDDTTIVSVDKDFYAVAGWFSRVNQEGFIDTTHVDEDTARFHRLKQSFMGDRTDGYFGCPEVGVVTATKKINKVTGTPGLVASTDALKVWNMIVSEYEKAGLGVEDATENYMVATILDGVNGWVENGHVRIKLPNGVINHA